MADTDLELDCVQLLDFQPNRYPFLMIDHVSRVVPGVIAKGHKNLSNNEWYFPVHFVGRPNMPGALQLEALAQLLTIAITTLPNLKGSITHALAHSVRFKREVRPGERLDLEVQVDSWDKGICKGSGRAFVNQEIACEANMTIAIPEILEKYLPRRK
jgi:3-hydroxyacyl-[acyl-carrier-protein] dehydratase